jgi:hypothetical protein
MTFQFNAAFPDATNEQKWEQIKLWRNAALAASDWTMHTDAPTDKVAWATYRQALRDITSQVGFPYNIVWPVIDVL